MAKQEETRVSAVLYMQLDSKLKRVNSGDCPGCIQDLKSLIY